MVQVAKSTQDFELFGGATLAPPGLRLRKVQKPKLFKPDAPFWGPQLLFLG